MQQKMMLHMDAPPMKTMPEMMERIVDKLAVVGAATHHVPAEVAADAKSRRQIAKRTQEMMVNILIERQKQENLFAEENPDRGSDMGEGSLDFDDCMELLDDGIDNGESILSGVL